MFRLVLFINKVGILSWGIFGIYLVYIGMFCGMCLLCIGYRLLVLVRLINSENCLLLVIWVLILCVCRLVFSLFSVCFFVCR